VRERAVALAMRRRHDRVVCLVVSLCEDYAEFCVKIMYCFMKTMDFR
jgi:hypothetical protein